MRLLPIPTLVHCLCFVSLSACSDYGFKWGGDDGPCGEVPCPVDTGDPPPPPEEICNGLDDDGDGAVDEDFADLDGDGVADCVDSQCEVTLEPAGTVAVEASCTDVALEMTDPWDVGIEWQYTVTDGLGVIVMPAVGNITDDNGDGKIDGLDNPDIVFTTWEQDHLIALHGDGSGIIWEKSGYAGTAGVAIADVDLDGVPDIIAATPGREIVAVDVLGNAKWTSEPFAWQTFPQPTVADLDGDGDVEVIFDMAIVEGSDGSTVAKMEGFNATWRAPVIADLDDDGQQEILLGRNCYSASGALLFQVNNVSNSAFAAVADIDGDPGGESFWVMGSRLYIVDDDGFILDQVQLDMYTQQPGPPSVADFDGDGEQEIVFSAAHRLEMRELDGTLVWTTPVEDPSGIAGVSGYDFDGDGVFEVLFADENALLIVDGATGVVLYRNESHSSRTLWEYPVIADVDGDGSAEIIFVSNGDDWQGVTVLGHNGSGWAKSGPTWPQHDFAVSNIKPNGAVPSPATPSWQELNMFRARPTLDDAGVDLQVGSVDSCLSGCEADHPGVLAFQVSNHGTVASWPGISISLYAVDGEVLSLLETQLWAGALGPGEQTPSVVFEFVHEDLGADGLLVSVDDDGSGSIKGRQDECDESNNQLAFTEWPC